MLCINSEIIDPYFNLAAEEILLKDKNEGIFLLWVGTPSIIVGKHQNTLGEINYHYAMSKNLDIARRLSGGGTVFHDGGNLNFTWILNGESGKLVDFKKFIDPVISFLKIYDIEAEYGGRNDIIVNGKKVSGNAEHVFKKRTLHHGTLLFNTDLNVLRSSLSINDSRYFDKAVKSVPHPVDNLKDLTKTHDTFNEFRSKLFSFILKKNKTNKEYKFSSSEIEKIIYLKETKYKSWDWIFGYSPKYKFKKMLTINKTEAEIEFEVARGEISRASIIKVKNKNLKDYIINSLNGSLHREDSISRSLHRNLKEFAVDHFEIETFTKQLF